MTIMKKILYTGIILVLVMTFAVTCDEGLAEDDIEYTDVVYSPDGSQVTVYFDGVTVPVTKAQRAMNRDLAMMAYDFLEVIFVQSSTNIARTNWELGMPAGINMTTAMRDGSDYAGVTKACLFAGKKSDKTLFGIGVLNTGSNIGASTPSVTFYISAILTGLQIPDTTKDPNLATGDPVTNSRGVAYASLDRATSSVNWGAVDYPLFDVPADAAVLNYKFGMVKNNTGHFAAAKLYSQTGTGADPVVAQRREPRFLDGGAYRQARTLTNTKVKVSVTTSATDFAALNNTSGVPITFNYLGDGGSGYFSVYLEAPVYMVNDMALASLTNKSDGGTEPVKWFIRTGYGSELYSLDDGTSSGGCALFGKDTGGGSTWLEIEWRWLPYS